MLDIVSYKEYAQAWIPLDELLYANAMNKRCKVVNFDSNIRTIAAPQYLNDLGVRKVLDPSLYFNRIQQLHPLEYFYSSKKSVISLLRESSERFGLEIEKFILLTGEYDTVEETICKYLQYTDIKEFDFINSLYVGMCLSAVENILGIDVLKYAIQHAPSDAQRIATMHRLAIAELKRFKNFDAAAQNFDLAISSIIDSEITDKEKRELKSIIYNGMALMYLMQGDKRRAQNTLKKAIKLVEGLVICETNSDSRVARYYLQEKGNLAQLYVSEGQFLQAKVELRTISEIVTNKAVEYLSEYHCILAVVKYMDRDYKEALDSALSALEGSIEIGAVISIKSAYNIIYASLSKLGFRDLAIKIASKSPLLNKYRRKFSV